MKQKIVIILLIFLLICSGLGIAAFTMSFTKKCGEGFYSKCEKPNTLCNPYENDPCTFGHVVGFETCCNPPLPGESNIDVCPRTGGHYHATCDDNDTNLKKCFPQFQCEIFKHEPGTRGQCETYYNDNTWKEGRYDGPCKDGPPEKACDPGLKCDNKKICQCGLYSVR